MESNSIPYNVIGNTVITGYSDSAGTGNKIINAIKYYKANPDKYKDIVKEVKKGNMKKAELNEEAINYEGSAHIIKVPLLTIILYLILIILWSIPLFSGNYNIIAIVICPVLLLINDIYGVYNWKRIKRKQAKKL